MDDQQPQTAAEKPAENDAVLLLRIEEMIKTHMSQIDTLQEDITKRKDMLNDIFTNDETYQEHDKIAKEGLSDYLREYQRLSGSNEIEGEDGELREIVYTAKLVKKSAQFSSR